MIFLIRIRFVLHLSVPKFAISQSEAKSTVLISYDIKSLTWYPAISWTLPSKVMLPYDKLQRGFANKQTTRNLIFSWCFAVERRCKNFSLPKLNWNTLANCVDKYLNTQTETMESELPTCEFGYGKYLTVPFWYASAAYQARLVSTASRQNTNHGSTKLAWYAAEAYQKGTIRYKYNSVVYNPTGCE